MADEMAELACFVILSLLTELKLTGLDCAGLDPFFFLLERWKANRVVRTPLFLTVVL